MSAHPRLILIIVVLLSAVCWSGRAWCIGTAGGNNPRLTLHDPPSSDGSPVLVSAALYVTNLSTIDEASESFSIEGYLTMSWRDERLADPASGRPFRQYNSDDIWIPSIEIANAFKYKQHSYVLKCDRNGLVEYTESFDADLSDDFWLREFPFDTQILRFVVQPFLTRQMTVVFAPEDLGSDFSHDAYAGVAAWSFEQMSYVPAVIALSGIVPQMPQARFELVVRRHSGFYIWKVFLPMIVMTIIPWSVFWVDAEQFDWQMKIPIATMLALIAFEFAIARDLPRVPYVTFLDAVFLTCFMYVFVSIVEIVTVYALLKAKHSKLAYGIHWHARWAVPLAYFCTLTLLIPIFFHGPSEPL